MNATYAGRSVTVATMTLSVICVAGCRSHHSIPPDFPSVAILNVGPEDIPVKLQVHSSRWEKPITVRRWTGFNRIPPGSYTAYLDDKHGDIGRQKLHFDARMGVSEIVLMTGGGSQSMPWQSTVAIRDMDDKDSSAYVKMINLDGSGATYDFSINKVFSDYRVSYGHGSGLHQVQGDTSVYFNAALGGATEYLGDDFQVRMKSRGIYFVTCKRDVHGTSIFEVYKDEHLVR